MLVLYMIANCRSFVFLHTLMQVSTREANIVCIARVEEHKRSAIGNHVKDEHGQDPETIKSNFRILRKCQSKLDCLIFEMLFIRDLKPKLNKQCDSIRAKLFV